MEECSTLQAPADDVSADPNGSPYPIYLQHGRYGRWRVADSPVCYVLEWCQGQDFKKWIGRRFFRTRAVLLRDINDLVPDPSPEAISKVESLPERHEDWPGYRPEDCQD